MDASKKKKLEAAGWAIGSPAEFLELSEAETQLVEIKLRLAEDLQHRRDKAGLTQAQLAKMLGTSQPRIATMLSAQSVSIGNLVRSLLVLGASASDVAKVLTGRKTRRT